MRAPSIVSSTRFSGIGRKLAIVVLAAFGIVVIFAEFIAPYDHTFQSRQSVSAPASPIRFQDAEGRLSFRPHVFALRLVDPLTRSYEPVDGKAYPVRFFVRGESYQLIGLIPASTHLFGVADAAADAPRVSLLGTDALGRDRFSRLVAAVRFSLLVCPAGAVLASLLGVLIGLVSGYAGRLVDTVLMGVADSMLSLPTLILILAARAAFPLELPPGRAAVLLITIFAFTGWATMGRLARGVVRSLKEKEYVLAARSVGLSEPAILLRHILPNAARPLLNQALVVLPYFLLSEVALSYLGVGLQEPAPSLGNMLASAADITELARHPFLVLSPAIVIFVFVLSIRVLSAGATETTERAV